MVKMNIPPKLRIASAKCWIGEDDTTRENHLNQITHDLDSSSIFHFFFCLSVRVEIGLVRDEKSGLAHSY